MTHSDATALRLLKHGPFGADLIRFPPGGRVPDHTHPGAHLLFVLGGLGWVDYEGEAARLEPGVCYLIPAGVRHGIRAESELTLLAVADDHRDAGSEDRLNVACE
jgi:quercetin dioxygenase-like cupin family protein